MADGSVCGFACAEGSWTGMPFTMAYQPIIDLPNRRIASYEALVRGKNGLGAREVLAQVTPDTRYAFDQACRVKAIELAAGLGLDRRLNINFMPNAVYKPETCIRQTLAAARRVAFPYSKLTFEIVEDERISDHKHLSAIVDEYRRHGFRVALDDFGSGSCGLNLLLAVKPDIVKLDMALIRDIDRQPDKRVVTGGVVRMCQELGIDVVAEGIENVGELSVLSDMAVRYFQGYLFAKPALERLVSDSEVNAYRLETVS